MSRAARRGRGQPPGRGGTAGAQTAALSPPPQPSPGVSGHLIRTRGPGQVEHRARLPGGEKADAEMGTAPASPHPPRSRGDATLLQWGSPTKSRAGRGETSTPVLPQHRHRPRWERSCCLATGDHGQILRLLRLPPSPRSCRVPGLCPGWGCRALGCRGRGCMGGQGQYESSGSPQAGRTAAGRQASHPAPGRR